MSQKPVTNNITVCDAPGCGEPIASNKQHIRLDSDWAVTVFGKDTQHPTVVPAGDYHRPCLRKLASDAIVMLRGGDE